MENLCEKKQKSAVMAALCSVHETLAKASRAA
jgi:hypothetical protein